MSYPKKKSRKILFFAGIAAALTVVTVLALNFAAARRARFENLERIRDHSESETLQQGLQELVDENMLGFSLNAKPVFKDGEATLFLKNDPENKHSFVVSIKLNETGEEVYRSELLPPGGEVIRDSLQKDLKQGEYPATAYIEGTAGEGAPVALLEADMLLLVKE